MIKSSKTNGPEAKRTGIMAYFIYKEDDLLGKVEKEDLNCSISEKLFELYGEEAWDLTVEESDAWSDAPDLLE